MKEYIYNNKIILGIIFLFALLVLTEAGYIYYLLVDKKVVEEPVISQIIEEEKEVIKTIFVDVKGEVKKPGVYEIDDGTIIIDVINKAGGFKDKAYKNNINLSKKLVNESVIYVYSKTEYKNLNKINNNLETCTSNNIFIDDCLEKGSSNIISTESSNEVNLEKETEDNSLININTATKEQLMTINGIGSSKADDILLYRETDGLFTKIEDIKNVSGIGDTTFEKIKHFITV